FRASLTFPPDRHPFKAVVRVGDRDIDATVNEANGVLTAKVPLQPGENRVQARLTNAWHAEASSEEIPVRYLRPPRVVGVDGPAESNKALVNVEARVESPL